MNPTRYLWIVLVLLIVAVVGLAGATTIDVPDCTVRTFHEIPITAGTFTNGLSGYNLTLSVPNSTLAEIYEVSFPAWATITTTSTCPGSSVTITAADLDDVIGAGDGATLATVRLHSLVRGDTTLNVTVNTFDDDVGGNITPTITNGTLLSRTSARVMATTAFTPVSTEAYNRLYESIGGNTSPESEAESLINWTEFLGATLSPYTLLIGNLAMVIIFSIPFILMWLMQSNMTPAAVAGLIIGVFLLAFLPAEYSLLAGILVVFALVAVVYSLFKERM